MIVSPDRKRLVVSEIVRPTFTATTCSPASGSNLLSDREAHREEVYFFKAYVTVTVAVTSRFPLLTGGSTTLTESAAALASE